MLLFGRNHGIDIYKKYTNRIIINKIFKYRLLDAYLKFAKNTNRSQDEDDNYEFNIFVFYLFIFHLSSIIILIMFSAYLYYIA